MDATPQPQEQQAATAAAPSPAPSNEDEGGGGIGLERLIFFSDAVFAIAITLLVLDIKVPEIPDGYEAAELAGRVREVAPNILAYFISFMIIAIFWMVHHGTFSYIRRYDRRLLWLNMYLLFFVAFLPFPSALLARYGNTFFAIAFYALFQIGISTLLTLIWVHAARDRRLVDPDLDINTIRLRFFRGLTTPLVFGTSILVGFLVNPYAAYIVWFLTAISSRLAALVGTHSNAAGRFVERRIFRLAK